LKKKRYLRVSITGIDGVGKTSAIHALLTHFAPTDVAVRYLPVDTEKKDVFSWIDGILEKIWLFSEKRGWKFILSLLYPIATLLYKPSCLLRFSFGREPRILINHRDPIIDSSVYVDFYWGCIVKILRLSQSAKIKWAKQIILEDLPDIVILLETDPEIALARIETRIKERKLEELQSPKSVKHFHETKKTLRELQAAFKEVLWEAKRIKPSMEVYCLNTERLSPKAIGFLVARIIKAKTA